MPPPAWRRGPSPCGGTTAHFSSFEDDAQSPSPLPLTSSSRRSIKRYFLMDQGDFFVHFMDLTEEELKKPVDDITPTRLEALLELALRMSTANTDPFKDDLEVGSGAGACLPGVVTRRCLCWTLWSGRTALQRAAGFGWLVPLRLFACAVPGTSPAVPGGSAPGSAALAGPRMPGGGALLSAQ